MHGREGRSSTKPPYPSRPSEGKTWPLRNCSCVPDQRLVSSFGVFAVLEFVCAASYSLPGNEEHYTAFTSWNYCDATGFGQSFPFPNRLQKTLDHHCHLTGRYHAVTEGHQFLLRSRRGLHLVKRHEPTGPIVSIMDSNMAVGLSPAIERHPGAALCSNWY